MRSPEVALGAGPGIRLISFTWTRLAAGSHTATNKGGFQSSGAPAHFWPLRASHAIWWPRSMETEQVAGGGSPGNTDILELKEFCIRAASPRGPERLSCLRRV